MIGEYMYIYIKIFYKVFFIFIFLNIKFVIGEGFSKRFFNELYVIRKIVFFLEFK